MIDEKLERTESEPFFSWLHAMDLARFNITISMVSPNVEHAARNAANGRPDVWVLRTRSSMRAGALHQLCGDFVPKDLLRPVVAVCDDDADDLGNALGNRVAAIVLTNDSPWQITSAIHSAAARKLFLSSLVLDQYREQVIELITSPPSKRLEALTNREHDVLICLAEGKSNSEIARRLYISRATVGSHVLSILRKLDAANRTEAAALAYQFGLMDSHRPRPAATVETATVIEQVQRRA